jgi:uncharacterized phage protein (TIGR02220 family)
MREHMQLVMKSSLWRASAEARLLYVAMVATCGKGGVVELSADELCSLANIPHNLFDRCIAELKTSEIAKQSGCRLMEDKKGRINLWYSGEEKPQEKGEKPVNLFGEPEKPATSKATVKAMAVELVEDVNRLSGRDFKPVQSTLAPIMERIKEVDGDMEGIKKMLATKKEEWGGNPEMWKYYNPITLFRAKNFHTYYGNRDLPVVKKAAMPAWLRRKDLTEKIAKSPANFSSVYFNPNHTKEQKEALIAMRKELATLGMPNE